MSTFFFFILLIFKSEAAVPAVIVIWVLSLLVFSGFPFYLPLLLPKEREKLWEKRRKGRKIFVSSFLFLVLVGGGIYGLLTSQFTVPFLLFWGILLFVLVFLLVGDLAGSTPFLISEFREEKGLAIEVDSEKCRGDGICGLVCPMACFSLDKQKKLAILERADKCICCGACIVQCQFDALSYADKQGRRVLPDFVRKHKIGLSGKRKPQKKVEMS
jgi:NAD-dependent dihydropyrimidine dehydrogenase PreA subunit